MSVRSLIMAAGRRSSYRYWRFHITANNGDNAYGALAEVEFRQTVGGADVTTTSTPVTSSIGQYSVTYKLINLVNNSTSSFWISTVNPVFPYWVMFDLGTAKDIRQIAIYPYTAGTGRAPTAFSVQGSNDGVNFTTVKSFTAAGWGAAWKYFEL